MELLVKKVRKYWTAILFCLEEEKAEEMWKEFGPWIKNLSDVDVNNVF